MIGEKVSIILYNDRKETISFICSESDNFFRLNRMCEVIFFSSPECTQGVSDEKVIV